MYFGLFVILSINIFVLYFFNYFFDKNEEAILLCVFTVLFYVVVR